MIVFHLPTQMQWTFPAEVMFALTEVTEPQFRVTQKSFKIMESPGMAELNRFLVERENSNYF